MTDSDPLKDKIALALVTSAGELNPNSKEDTLRRAMMYLDDIDKRGEFQLMYAEEPVKLCVPIYVEDKRPDGDPVVFKKKKAGVIVLWHDSFILSREWGMMSNKTQAGGYDDTAVEMVTTNFSGTEMLGLRLTNREEKIKTVLTPHQALHDSDPAAQAKLVGQIAELFSSAPQG